MGIEPTPPAWKAGALPLSYARVWPPVAKQTSDSDEFEVSLDRYRTGCVVFIKVSRLGRVRQNPTPTSMDTSGMAVFDVF